MDKVSIITVHYTGDTIGSSLDNDKRTMNAHRDVLFTIQIGYSHRTLLEPDILQCPWWQEDSTTDLYLSHVYLLFTLIYAIVKNKLFDSFRNDNSCIKHYFNRTKILILSSF